MGQLIYFQLVIVLRLTQKLELSTSEALNLKFENDNKFHQHRYSFISIHFDKFTFSSFNLCKA